MVIQNILIMKSLISTIINSLEIIHYDDMFDKAIMYTNKKGEPLLSLSPQLGTVFILEPFLNLLTKRLPKNFIDHYLLDIVFYLIDKNISTYQNIKIMDTFPIKTLFNGKRSEYTPKYI